MPKDDRIRTPFQGEFLGGKNPGLKAWAILLNRFAANPTDTSVSTSPLFHTQNSKPKTQDPKLKTSLAPPTEIEHCKQYRRCVGKWKAPARL